VRDPARYRQYIQATPAVVARFGGRFIARGGELLTLEGPQEKRRLVIIEFPSLEKAKQFFHSDEYVEVKKLRAGAARAEFVMVNGVVP